MDEMDGQRIVTFVDFVQTMAIRSIRQQKRLSLQKIRQTVEASKELGVQYPFARKHQTFLFEDDVVIRLADKRLIQVTGKYKHSQLIRQVVELYMDDLGFDEEGLANLYTPMKEGEDRKIVLDPTQRFGAPLVLPCNYTVETLVQMVRAEGSIADAADACDVEEADVKIALRYEDMLSGVMSGVAA